MILRIGSKSWVSVIGFRVSGLGAYRKPSTESRTPRTEFGFTLVELLISVVILGFGLSIILRTYLTALTGLDSSQNYIESLRFAQGKINELEITSYENNGLSPESDSEKIKIGPREFIWKTEIGEISNPEYLSRNCVLAAVSLDWQERNIPKNTTLVTYLHKKKESQAEK